MKKSLLTLALLVLTFTSAWSAAGSLPGQMTIQGNKQLKSETLEDGLVALLGDKIYSNSNGDRIYVDDNKVFWDGMGQGYLSEWGYTLSMNGDNYVFSGSDSYTFVVENGKVTKIEYVWPSYPKENSTYYPGASESDLVALMGENEYVASNGFIIKVTESSITNSMLGEANFASSYSLSTSGDNYVYTRDNESYTFVVENGTVTKVVYVYTSKPANNTTYYPRASESDLVALMGENGYGCTKGYTITVSDNSIYVDNNYSDNYLSERFSLYKDGDNFIYNNSNSSYTFVVEDDEVTKVEYVYTNHTEYNTTYTPQASQDDLIELMNGNTYSSPVGYYIKADNDNVFNSYFDAYFVENRYALFMNGDNYVFYSNIDSYTFVVESSGVTKVEQTYTGKSEPEKTFFRTVQESNLVELMDKNGYVDENIYTIEIIENELHFDNIGSGIFSQSGMILYMDGGNYIYTNGTEHYTFVVEYNEVVEVKYVYDTDTSQNSTYTPMASESELVALMGENTYKSVSDLYAIRVEDDKVYTTQFQDNFSASGYHLIKDNDHYIFVTQYDSYFFTVENGTVSFVEYVVYSYPEDTRRYYPTATEEKLIALLDENGYGSTKGYSIFVSESSLNFYGDCSFNFSEQGYELLKTDNNYTYSNGGEYYTFVVKDGNVTKVEYVKTSNTAFNSTFTPMASEAELVALMSQNGYIDEDGREIHFDDDKVYDYGINEYLSSGLHCVLFKEDDNYVFFNSMHSYTFVVEDGTVTKVEYIDANYPKDVRIYTIKPSEADLIALMNGKSYCNGASSRIYVEDNRVYNYGDIHNYLSSEYTTLTKDGDNYVYGDDQTSFTFVVKNGTVATVEFKSVDHPEFNKTFYPMCEVTELIALMDANGYSNSNGAFISSTESMIYATSVEYPLTGVENSQLCVVGNNYVLYHGQYTITFVVEDDEVTKIEFVDKMNPGQNMTLYPQKSTGVSMHIAPETEKARKTILDGRIVIIRNGNVYDLSGARIR